MENYGCDITLTVVTGLQQFAPQQHGHPTQPVHIPLIQFTCQQSVMGPLAKKRCKLQHTELSLDCLSDSKMANAIPSRMPAGLAHVADMEDNQDPFLSFLRDNGNADTSTLMSQLRAVVREELAKASHTITTELRHDVREIGHRTAALELGIDDANLVLTGPEEDLELAEKNIIDLKTEIESPDPDQPCNIMIRGFLETVEDLQ